MDIDERIDRRRRASRGSGLVTGWRALDPTRHIEDPVGRSATLERLLDVLDPVFDGATPANAYVHGPPGAGKSAVVSVLFGRLSARFDRGDVIGTTTRTTGANVGVNVAFAYADARRYETPFRLYGAVGNALVAGGVPDRGVGTAELADRVAAAAAERDAVVVAVDHVGEPGTASLTTVAETFDALPGVSWMAVGRAEPDELATDRPEKTVRVDRYRSRALVDVLSTRASRGLRRGIGHDVARRVAAWAEGDAHDALAAVFGAADAALVAGRSALTDDDLSAGMEAVPRDGVPTARVLSLPENRKRVLDALLALESADATLAEAAEAVAERTDLSAATVKRYLYELADERVLARVPTDDERTGRAASRVVPRFPTRVYRRLREDEADA